MIRLANGCLSGPSRGNKGNSTVERSLSRQKSVLFRICHDWRYKADISTWWLLERTIIPDPSMVTSKP